MLGHTDQQLTICGHVQPISRFLLMCVFNPSHVRVALIAGAGDDFEKLGNCNDFTSFDKVFDAPESLREISPRFQDCLLAVGFTTCDYPAWIESKCRQQRSSSFY